MLKHLGIITLCIFSSAQDMFKHQEYLHIMEKHFNAMLVREELSMWLQVRVAVLVIIPSGLVMLSHVVLDLIGPQKTLGIHFEAQKNTTLLALAFTMKFS